MSMHSVWCSALLQFICARTVSCILLLWYCKAWSFRGALSLRFQPGLQGFSFQSKNLIVCKLLVSMKYAAGNLHFTLSNFRNLYALRSSSSIAALISYSHHHTEILFTAFSNLKGNSHQILLSEMSLPGIEVLTEKLLPKILVRLGKENPSKRRCKVAFVQRKCAVTSSVWVRFLYATYN